MASSVWTPRDRTRADQEAEQCERQRGWSRIEAKRPLTRGSNRKSRDGQRVARAKWGREHDKTWGLVPHCGVETHTRQELGAGPALWRRDPRSDQRQSGRAGHVRTMQRAGREAGPAPGEETSAQHLLQGCLRDLPASPQAPTKHKQSQEAEPGSGYQKTGLQESIAGRQGDAVQRVAPRRARAMFVEEGIRAAWAE